jgi:hypothetical protein
LLVTPSTFTLAPPTPARHRLTALTGDIAVIFHLARETEPDPARAESEHRSVHARFVVTMLWPPGAEIDEDD